MKLIITGSRDWEKESFIWDALHVFTDAALDRGEPIIVVHGDCPTGADAIADFVATERGFDVRRYPADWKKHGPAAGPKRNKQMVDENLDAEYVLAFPLGISKGTRGCMKYAKDKGLDVINLGEKLDD